MHSTNNLPAYQQEPADRPQLDRAIDESEQVVQRVLAQASMLRDRLLGPRPTPADDSRPAPGYLGRTIGIGQAVMQIEQILQEIAKHA